MDGLMILFVALFVIGAIVMGITQSKRANESWTHAARRLGFEFYPGGVLSPRSMSGRLGDYRVVVDTYSRGSGKNRRTYTRFRVLYPQPLRLGLRLTREGFFSGFGKLLGTQDIEVGDLTFDSDILVKGSDPRKVIEFLTPPRRMRIHRFLTARRDAVVSDSEIRWDRRGVVRDAGEIISTVHNLVRVAWHLTGDRESDVVLERAMKAQNEGRIGDALAILGQVPGVARRRQGRRQPTAAPPLPPPAAPPAAPAPPPIPPQPVEFIQPPAEEKASQGEDEVLSLEILEESDEKGALEEQVMEGEILYLAGRREEAKEVFESVLKEVPEDPEVRQWVEQVSRPSDATKMTPPGEAADLPLDVASVCGELFDPSRSSLDASRIFEEKYEGNEVKWSGTLKSADSYSYDFVLGSSPGTKAVFEVHKVKASFYGENAIFAVVQLPPEAKEELAGKIGEAIGFEGKLLKADGFMRNIYIREGKLTT